MSKPAFLAVQLALIVLAIPVAATQIFFAPRLLKSRFRAGKNADREPLDIPHPD